MTPSREKQCLLLDCGSDDLQAVRSGVPQRQRKRASELFRVDRAGTKEELNPCSCTRSKFRDSRIIPIFLVPMEKRWWSIPSATSIAISSTSPLTIWQSPKFSKLTYMRITPP